jgi:3-hydroxyisobutyrate dehydrogenase-like beta-hydroxyacid dehydrogenase
MADRRRIGFIGLGGMGRGLVKNLLKHGHAVTVLDRSDDAVAQATALGAQAGSGLAELRQDCEVVAFCVSTATDVEALVLGPQGLLAAPLQPGQIVVDHTTTNPDTVARLDAAVAASGGDFAEAPLTRTPKHADAGCVNVLYGGGAELLQRLEPVFRCYAQNVFHVGPSGHAIRLKLIHNYIAFANVAAWCEGFALAAKEGLDLSRVIEIISAAGARSGMLDLYGRPTLEGDFTPWMSLANARKDVRYYARWLEQAGLPGGLAEAVHQTYRLAELMGHDEESCTAVIKVYERLSGVAARLPGEPV